MDMDMHTHTYVWFNNNENWLGISWILPRPSARLVVGWAYFIVEGRVFAGYSVALFVDVTLINVLKWMQMCTTACTTDQHIDGDCGAPIILAAGESRNIRLHCLPENVNRNCHHAWHPNQSGTGNGCDRNVPADYSISVTKVRKESGAVGGRSRAHEQQYASSGVVISVYIFLVFILFFSSLFLHVL